MKTYSQLFVYLDSLMPVHILFPDPLKDEETSPVDFDKSTGVPVNTSGHLQARFWSISIRTVLTTGAVLASILFPGFTSWNAFMGSVTCFVYDFIFPILAKRRLSKRLSIHDYALFAVVLILMAYARLCN